jgi:hypothetical protein
MEPLPGRRPGERPILIPIALAVLLAFVIGPVVSSLVEARSQLLPWIQFVQNAPASPGQQREPRVA